MLPGNRIERIKRLVWWDRLPEAAKASGDVGMCLGRIAGKKTDFWHARDSARERVRAVHATANGGRYSGRNWTSSCRCSQYSINSEEIR